MDFFLLCIFFLFFFFDSNFNFLFFFFSSRRRHTRYWRDWSSDCALPISLRVLDHPELLVGHFGVIRNARRQARRRRLVPRRQSREARQLANLVLRQIHFVERAAHAELARGLPARTVVAAIVRVVAV